MAIKIRYPAGPITPVGAVHLLKGDQPMVAYRSFDDQVVFNLMGPLAYRNNTIPESIRLLDLKGLIPPWSNITQKAATQDGATYVTSLYDPMEVDLTVLARGRRGAPTRKLIRHWIDSWDAKRAGTLSWRTPELGYWWANLQWAKAPFANFMGGNFTRQRFDWKAIAYDAFWRSYPTTDVFAFSYLSATDEFDYDTLAEQDLGDDWEIEYSGTGSGYLFADGIAANGTLGNGRWAVAQRDDYVSATDTQIITVTIGPVDPWPAATDAYLDIWARMENNGTPGQNGVRLRLGYQPPPNVCSTATSFLRLSYFVGGVETLIRQTNVDVPWKPTDQISFAVGGFNGALKSYYVQRGTNPNASTTNVTWATVMTVVNTTDGSLSGAGYRGAGFGMQADGIITPPSVACWTAGDSTAAQEGGYVTLRNCGDQPMWPFFILVGPGEFAIGDGPNATQAVVYGPLEQNQMVFIQTDPRRYAVTDMTSMPPPGVPATSQRIKALEAAFAAYQSFLSNSNTPSPALSVFGTPFPQGNPYALMQGRFSRPIPAKLPGSPAPEAQIAVAVESGSPTTAILAGGVPLRRFPQ
jgi:hypothetical protein